MCGIVGYIGNKNALPVLIEGLGRLEYRGYDSAGVAYLDEGRIVVTKRKGRLRILADELEASGLLAPNNHERVNIGIGHTRWATHGAPSDENSHPHLSDSGRIAVVHNGIIENYLELKTFLIERGVSFKSETDTEVIAHLVERHYQLDTPGDLLSAVRLTLSDLEGSYALGVLCADNPDQIIAARKDSPLVVGLGDGCNYIASDIPAILGRTRRILILADREIVCLNADETQIFDSLGRAQSREPMLVAWDSEAAEKGGFEHFMLKEIHEEPRAVRDTLMPRIRESSIRINEIDWTQPWVSEIDQVRIVACGTAYHAGVIGKYIIEKLARIPVEVDVASEFRYRDPLIGARTLVIIISQSGETLDTLAAMREAKRLGGHVLAIVNVVGSSIAREADAVFYTAAGPEIAVASTKAYSTQLAAIYLISLQLAEIKGRLDNDLRSRLIDSLVRLPAKLDETLQVKDQIQRFVADHFNARHIFFIGRGLDYALAMEASLKLKEISYIHSEAYAGGELKHGTIALIEEGTLVVCPLTQPSLLDKMISNIREVKARGAVVLGIISPACMKAASVCDSIFPIPETEPLFSSLLAVTPAQLFAYYMSLYKGLDVDKPRNLAKSVTVE